MITRYLLSNKITILVHQSGFTTEYKSVYQKQIKIYKGVSNTIDFRLKNEDQKPVTVDNAVVHFIMYNELKNQILHYNTIQGNILKSHIPGAFTVVISANDTINLQDQFLTYVIFIEREGQTSITFADESFQAVGDIELLSSAFPVLKESYRTTFIHQNATFMNQPVSWVTSVIDQRTTSSSSQGLHTVAIYSNNYSGDVEVQATLDPQPVSEHTEWTTIATANIQENATVTPVNFVGIFSFIRLYTTTDPIGKIPLILIRS